MALINNVTLNGKIVTDIELRKTNNKGIPVVNFRLQHNGPKLANPVYVDVEVWAKEAERLAETAKRGSYVVVYGEIRRDVWKADDDSPRSKLKITANSVIVDQSNESRPSTENVSF